MLSFYIDVVRIDYISHNIELFAGKLMTSMINIASSPSTQRKRFIAKSRNATGLCKLAID